MAKPDSIVASAPVAPPPFTCSRMDVGLDAAWVHVAGELDIATTPELEWTLREAGVQAQLVALDLRDVTFMDSSGAHAIVDASLHALQIGRRLILLRGPPNVDRVFALTGHADAVEIADIDPGEPPVGLLRQRADADLAP
jgi:anti-anti-sigma factor